MFDVKVVSKSIAAVVAAAIVSFLMKKNVVIADGLPDALEVIISAVLVGVTVYLAPKNQPKGGK